MNYFTPAALVWLESVLQERFGHSFELKELNHTLTLSLPGTEGDIVFDSLQPIFHQSRSDFPCQSWCSSGEGFVTPIEDLIPAPATDSLPTRLIELHEQGVTIHYDILGLTYWMLTRLEEIGRTDLDNHQRFPATSSHAFKHGYLERPIVDEWLNVLGQVMLRVWPEIELKQHEFNMKVSHDVDGPARYAFQNFKGLVRTMGGDVLVRKDIAAALKAPWIWLNCKRAIHPKDPANTFDWLMTQSEENGLTSAFYFICGRTDASKDAKYDPEMPQIRKLMREIHRRGHEIGLHPSYNTYNRPEEIAKEADRLRKVCGEEGIQQTEWGGRMHFLRWDQAITQKAWADAGMSYDSTLSYADRPGFRCGTCFEYPAFDAATDKPLKLRIRPLVAMDCTVIAERYLGLGSTEAAYEKFNELKNKCRKVGGVFTLLWHNSFFSSPNDFDIYRRLVSER
ncbi:MAG: polysaccharide deacetylase family protein [Marinobacter sp.]|uniref:polysaccharide deacetylase family protein n=2 Tax=Marinobacter sp. TaxID=50741 RepID=UPI003298BF2A